MDCGDGAAVHDDWQTQDGADLSRELVLKRRAFWILKLKEKHHLPVEQILSDITELCQELVGDLGQEITKVFHIYKFRCACKDNFIIYA